MLLLCLLDVARLDFWTEISVGEDIFGASSLMTYAMSNAGALLGQVDPHPNDRPEQ